MNFEILIVSKYNNFKDITTYTEQIIEDYRKNNKKQQHNGDKNNQNESNNQIKLNFIFC